MQFNRKFGFSITWNVTYCDNGKVREGDLYYWEYLLDFLYYRKDIVKSCDSWTDTKGVRVPTEEFSLNENGLKYYKHKLKII